MSSQPTEAQATTPTDAEIAEMSLGDLFREADRIGNKYLTPEEIAVSKSNMAQVHAEIAAIVNSWDD